MLINPLPRTEECLEKIGQQEENQCPPQKEVGEAKNDSQFVSKNEGNFMYTTQRYYKTIFSLLILLA